MKNGNNQKKTEGLDSVRVFRHIWSAVYAVLLSAKKKKLSSLHIQKCLFPISSGFFGPPHPSQTDIRDGSQEKKIKKSLPCSRLVAFSAPLSSSLQCFIFKWFTYLKMKLGRSKTKQGEKKAGGKERRGIKVWFCGGIIRAGSLKGQLPMCFVIIWFKFILKWEGGGTIYSTCSSYTYYFTFLDWVQTQLLLNARTTTVPASKNGADLYLFPNTKRLYFSHMLFLSVMRRSVNFLQEDLMFLFFV